MERVGGDAFGERDFEATPQVLGVAVFAAHGPNPRLEAECRRGIGYQHRGADRRVVREHHVDVHVDSGTAEGFGEAGDFGSDDVADVHGVSRPAAVGRHQQVDGGDTGGVEGSLPAVAEHLRVADVLEGCDECPVLEQVWRQAVVGVGGGAKREVEAESQLVKEHRDAADESAL